MDKTKSSRKGPGERGQESGLGGTATPRILQGFLYRVFFTMHTAYDLECSGMYVVAENMHDAMKKLAALYPEREIAMLSQEDRSSCYRDEAPRPTRLIL